jgi:hypothetical protein
VKSYAEFSRALYQRESPQFMQALQGLEQRHGGVSQAAPEQVAAVAAWQMVHDKSVGEQLQ